MIKISNMPKVKIQGGPLGSVFPEMSRLLLQAEIFMAVLVGEQCRHTDEYMQLKR